MQLSILFISCKIVFTVNLKCLSYNYVDHCKSLFFVSSCVYMCVFVCLNVSVYVCNTVPGNN